MLADDLLSHFVLGSTYHVNCLGFVTVSTFFAVYLKLLVWFNLQLVCTGLYWSGVQRRSRFYFSRLVHRQKFLSPTKFHI